MMKWNWHEKHSAGLTFGQRFADKTAQLMGSWAFIIVQSIFVIGWMSLNFVAWIVKWDPYPFILLNLVFSIQAAYAAPIIMMAQNRQNERDRVQAEADYATDQRVDQEVGEIQKTLMEVKQIVESIEKKITPQ